MKVRLFWGNEPWFRKLISFIMQYSSWVISKIANFVNIVFIRWINSVSFGFSRILKIILNLWLVYNKCYCLKISAERIFEAVTLVMRSYLANSSSEGLNRSVISPSWSKITSRCVVSAASSIDSALKSMLADWNFKKCKIFQKKNKFSKKLFLEITKIAKIAWTHHVFEIRVV